jgi:exosortase
MATAASSTVDKPWFSRDRGVNLLFCLKIILIGSAVVPLYSWVAMDLAHDWWTQPSLSYGLLVPPLAIYVAWLKREAILAVPVTRDSRGLVLAVLACLMYLIGKLGSEFFLQRLSMVVLLTAFVWTFWGSKRMAQLAFPLVLLAAAVPLPVIVYNLLAAPLQLFASDIAADLARLAGITVYRDGNILQLAGTSLGVEEACSGLNSLSSLLVGALLLGHLACSRLHTKVLLFFSAIPIAIGVNVLRVTGTAILADYRPEWAMGFYHLFEGWMVFLLGFAALFGVAKLFSFLLDRRRA